MNAPVSSDEVRAMLQAAGGLDELHLGSLPIGTNVIVKTYQSEYRLRIFDPVSGLVVCQSTSKRWGRVPLVATYAGLSQSAEAPLVRTSWIRQGFCMSLHIPQARVTSSNVETIRLVRAFPDEGEFIAAIAAHEAAQEAKRLRIILNPLSDSARNEVRCAIAEFPKAGRAMLIEFFLAATRERRMRAAIAVFQAQSQRHWNHLLPEDWAKPLTRLDRDRLRDLFQSLGFEVPEVVS